jgi:hypothetical protein
MSSFQAVTTRPHRAFRALHWRSRDLFVNLALVCLLTGVWIASLRWICRLWIFVFRVGAEAIGQPQALEVSQHVWAPWIHFYIPYLALSTGAPTVTSWTITVFVVLLAWVGTYWLRGPALPLGYLVRAAVIIMCTSLVYFAFGSARFPHDLASYNTSMLSVADVPGIDLLHLGTQRDQKTLAHRDNVNILCSFRSCSISATVPDHSSVSISDAVALLCLWAVT